MWDDIIPKKLPQNKADRNWYCACSEIWADHGSENRRKTSCLVITGK